MALRLAGTRLPGMPITPYATFPQITGEPLQLGSPSCHRVAETHLQAKGRKQCGYYLNGAQNHWAHLALDVLKLSLNLITQQSSKIEDFGVKLTGF